MNSPTLKDPLVLWQTQQPPRPPQREEMGVNNENMSTRAHYYHYYCSQILCWSYSLFLQGATLYSMYSQMSDSNLCTVQPHFSAHLSFLYLRLPPPLSFFHRLNFVGVNSRHMTSQICRHFKMVFKEDGLTVLSESSFVFVEKRWKGKRRDWKREKERVSLVFPSSPAPSPSPPCHTRHNLLSSKTLLNYSARSGWIHIGCMNF